MIRLLVSVALLGAMGSMAGNTFAADTYKVPPHPASTVNKCAVTQDVGQPVAKKDGSGNWDVSTTGKYNYDTAWAFKSLKAEIVYTKGVRTRFGPSTTIPDETTIGTAGTFSFSFPGLSPPAADEVMNLRVDIVVQKTGEADKTESHAKAVPAP